MIIAIVVQALWGLGKSAVKGLLTGLVGAAVMLLFFLRMNEILLLFAAGFVVMILENLWRNWKQGTLNIMGALPLWVSSASVATGAPMAATPDPARFSS